jgi:hypothetical protein
MAPMNPMKSRPQNSGTRQSLIREFSGGSSHSQGTPKSPSLNRLRDSGNKFGGNRTVRPPSFFHQKQNYTLASESDLADNSSPDRSRSPSKSPRNNSTVQNNVTKDRSQDKTNKVTVFWVELMQSERVLDRLRAIEDRALALKTHFHELSSDGTSLVKFKYSAGRQGRCVIVIRACLAEGLLALAKDFRVVDYSLEDYVHRAHSHTYSSIRLYTHSFYLRSSLNRFVLQKIGKYRSRVARVAQHPFRTNQRFRSSATKPCNW